MMIKQYSSPRFHSKKMVFLPVLVALTLMFCTNQKESDYSDFNFSTTYNNVDLHYDADRSEELGVYFGAQYTSDGELFTGTQRVYHKENDHLHIELHYKDGINIGSVMTRDGDIYRQVHGIYLDKPHFKEMYVNDILVHQDVPPTESEDGMGHIRMWHENGELAFEVSYTGDTVYRGLMTEYDEDGNITMQERHEDGEVVEKIK